MHVALDHLVLLCPDLAAGIARVEEETGVRPAMGGQHGNDWTENALARLGDGIYLELLSATAIAPQGRDPWVDRCRALRQPELFAWCARSDGGLATIAARLADEGVAASGPEPWQRKRPDGVVLSWELVDPAPGPLDPALPFFIDWAGSPHPSEDAPGGLAIEEFRIQHEEVDAIRRIVGDPGVGVRFQAGAAALSARIRGPGGAMTVSSNAGGERE